MHIFSSYFYQIENDRLVGLLCGFGCLVLLCLVIIISTGIHLTACADGQVLQATFKTRFGISVGKKHHTTGLPTKEETVKTTCNSYSLNLTIPRLN